MMKKYILTAVLAVLLGLGVAACAPTGNADHDAAGVSAELAETGTASLNEPAANAFGGPIPEFDEGCLSCHESYEKVAEATAHYGDSNPHDSVHGSYQSCGTCHPGDKQIPAQHQCMECHEWPRELDSKKL